MSIVTAKAPSEDSPIEEVTFTAIKKNLKSSEIQMFTNEKYASLKDAYVENILDQLGVGDYLPSENVKIWVNDDNELMMEMLFDGGLVKDFAPLIGYSGDNLTIEALRDDLGNSSACEVTEVEK